MLRRVRWLRVLGAAVMLTVAMGTISGPVLGAGRIRAAAPFSPAAANTITVYGSGELALDEAKAPVRPQVAEELELSVQVEETGTDVKAAVTAVEAKVQAVRAALRSLGVADPDMDIREFTVMPVREQGGAMGGFLAPPVRGGAIFPAQPTAPAPAADPTSDPAPEPRYQVRAGLTVHVRDENRIGDLAQAAIQAGADSVHTASHYASFSSLSAFPQPSAQQWEQAMRAALVDARAKADAIAATLGLKVGQVVSVSATPLEFYGGASGQVVLEVVFTVEKA